MTALPNLCIVPCCRGRSSSRSYPHSSSYLWFYCCVVITACVVVILNNVWLWCRKYHASETMIVDTWQPTTTPSVLVLFLARWFVYYLGLCSQSPIIKVFRSLLYMCFSDAVFINMTRLIMELPELHRWSNHQVIGFFPDVICFTRCLRTTSIIALSAKVAWLWVEYDWLTLL
jgi:hypothetical protein